MGVTGEELALLKRAVRHMGCNCGDNECFTEAEMDTAEYAINRVPVSLIGRVKMTPELVEVVGDMKL